MQITSNNTNFKSRCKAIETANQACRQLSLLSSSKKNFVLNDLKQKNKITNINFEYNRFKSAIYDYTLLNRKIRKLRNGKGHFELGGIRLLLEQVSNLHVGNCGESAEFVALVLNMNGFKNACVTTLRSEFSPIDHEVCIFNKNSKPFYGHIENNETIIADPWSGIVDFANTALKRISATCADYFHIDKDQKIMINPKFIHSLKLNENDLSCLREEHPELIFK